MKSAAFPSSNDIYLLFHTTWKFRVLNTLYDFVLDVK